MKFTEKLLKEYTPLINTTAHSYGIDDTDMIEDLKQEGRIGLWQATIKFDETKGAFPSYAKIWIKKYQLRFLDNHIGNIRIPVNLKNKELKANFRTISINTSINDSNILLIHSIPNEVEDDQIDIEPLKRAILMLKPRQQEIINLYYGMADKFEKKVTMKNIGQKFNVTDSAIEQQINSIKRKLKLIISGNQPVKKKIKKYLK